MSEAHVHWVRDIATDPDPDWGRYRARFDTLTNTEKRTVLALCSGQADRNKNLARMLGCAVGTARNHTQRSLVKIGVHNTAALVAVAFNTGWVDEQRARTLERTA